MVREVRELWQFFRDRRPEVTARSARRSRKATVADIRTNRLAPDEYAQNFSDAHPPLTPAQALVESDRCFFCYDAPCIQPVDRHRHPKLHPQNRTAIPRARRRTS